MNTKNVTKVAMIAAIYTVVSLVIAPLSFGPLQVRIAEGLTLLPLIFPPAIIGVTIGCALTNFFGALMGANILGMMDIIVGTSATLIAALLTYCFRNIKIKNIPVLSILMPVILNGLIVGAELAYVLYPPNEFMSAFALNGLYVAIGELVSVIVGYFIIQGLKKTKIFD